MRSGERNLTQDVDDTCDVRAPPLQDQDAGEAPSADRCALVRLDVTCYYYFTYVVAFVFWETLVSHTSP